MHRRRLLIASVGLVAVAAAGNSIPRQRSVADEIIELDMRLNQAILAHDVAAASALYDGEFVLTASGGRIKRKADMLADIGNPAVALSVCETRDVNVRVRANTAVLTGTLLQAGSVNGRELDVKLHVTDTWVSVDGRWLLFAAHASPAP